MPTILLNSSDFANMWYLTGAYRANGISWKRQERDRFTIESHKLDLESFASVVDMNDRAHIPLAETVTRPVSRQCNNIEFFDHGAFPFAATAVTKRGGASPTMIQTVLTAGSLPLGVRSGPEISYFVP